MHNDLIVISEAWRMFKRSIRIKFSGFERLDGDDERICKQIVDKCDNKRYIQTSLYSYTGIYARDLGICIDSFISLGYKKSALKSLEYMLKIYTENNAIKVFIDHKDRPCNFPNKYSPDSIAYFFRSLRVSQAKDLISKYEKFLNSEIRRFEEIVIDKKKGIVKNRSFSGMRDHEIAKSSCYDMIMACMLSDEIDKINLLMGKKILDNPLKKYGLKKNLIKYYWNGKYFKNSIEDKSLTGHCNVFPYWLDVITDKKMMISSLSEIQKAGLDKPFPLKYGHSSKTRFVWQEIFAYGWEKDTVWIFLGLPYIELVSRVNKSLAKKYLIRYKKNIEEYKGFIEVYNDDGTPYDYLFYSADTAMVWAVMYLDLKKRISIN